MRALGWAAIDENQALGDELLHASSADALETGSDALIEAFAGLVFGNNEFMKRGFAALAHREIVAAVTMAYRTTVGRGVKAEASLRYSIIVDSATNFRVWSLRVTGVSIALRVTKLRKNRTRRGRPKPPREIEAVGLGRFSSSTSLAFISTRKVKRTTARVRSLPPLELSNRFFLRQVDSRKARNTCRDAALGLLCCR